MFYVIGRRFRKMLVLLVCSVALRAQQRGSGSEPLKEIESLLSQVQQQIQSGDPSSTKRTIAELIGRTESAFGKQSPATGLVLNQLAELISATGDYNQARPYAERALQLLETNLGPDRTEVADALMTLAALNAGSGEFLAGEALYRRSLQVYERTPGKNSPAYAHALDMLGAVLLLKGDTSGAESMHREALSIEETALGRNHFLVAVTLQNLAKVYDNLVDIPRAEEHYRRALTIFQSIPRSQPFGMAAERMVAIMLGKLAGLSDEKGEHVRAQDLYDQSIKLLTEATGANSPLLATLYLTQAQSALFVGDTDKALRSLSAAYNITNRFGNENLSSVMVMQTIGSVYLTRGQLDRAKLLFIEAALRIERWPERNVWIRLAPLFSLALIELAKGNHNDAEFLSKEAIAMIQGTYGANHPRLVRPLLCLKDVLLAKGDSEGAVATMARVVDIEERSLRLVLAAGSEAQKAAFMGTVEVSTDAAVALHMQKLPQNRRALRLALETILRRKGRVLDEVSSSSRLFRSRFRPNDRPLLDSLNTARAALAKLVFQGSDGRQNAEILRQEVRRCEEDLHQIEAAVMQRNSAYAPVVRPITLEDVQMKIPVDAALVEIVAYRPDTVTSPTWGPKLYAAYVLKRTGEPAAVTLGPALEIDGLVAGIRSAMRNPERRDVKALARSLDAKIMAPVRALTGLTPHILISPDGALNLLPFEALIDPSGRYLIEGNSFTYLTSGRDIATALAVASQGVPVILADPTFDLGRASSNPSIRGAVAADFQRQNYSPLPATAEEARQIELVLPDAVLFTGAAATEQELKRVKGPRILHIATHGFFLGDVSPNGSTTRLLTLTSTDYPVRLTESKLLRSGLVLAGVKQGASGTGEDGIVTALEVAGLDLSGTKLAVLSACDTGVGEISNSEGVYGLRRALVMAGAESQIISLWPVSDGATKDLMGQFYRRLKSGESRSEAFRQARLTMLRSQRQVHPYYWAAFVQSGDWTAMPQ